MVCNHDNVPCLFRILVTNVAGIFLIFCDRVVCHSGSNYYLSDHFDLKVVSTILTLHLNGDHGSAHCETVTQHDKA